LLAYVPKVCSLSDANVRKRTSRSILAPLPTSFPLLKLDVYRYVLNGPDFALLLIKGD